MKLVLQIYKTNFLCTISNNIEVYEDPVPRTKKIHDCAVKFEAGEEKRIVQEILYCLRQMWVFCKLYSRVENQLATLQPHNASQKIFSDTLKINLLFYDYTTT